MNIKKKKIFLAIEATTQHEKIIESLSHHHSSLEWIAENLFVGDELEYVKWLGTKSAVVVERCIRERRVCVWSEQLKHDYIAASSQLILAQEETTILAELTNNSENTPQKANSIEDAVRKFIRAASFHDQRATHHKLELELAEHRPEKLKLARELIERASAFKENLFASDMHIKSRRQWCALVEALKLLRTQQEGSEDSSNKISMEQLAHILKYSQLFVQDEEAFTDQLMATLQAKPAYQSSSAIYMKVLLASFDRQVRLLCSSSGDELSTNRQQQQKHVEVILKEVHTNVSHRSAVDPCACAKFLRMLIAHLGEDFRAGVRFVPSEVYTLEHVLKMINRLNLFDHEQDYNRKEQQQSLPSSLSLSQTLRRLEKVRSVLKWHQPLRAETIKCELNRQTDSDADNLLVIDILSVEKACGVDLTSRLIKLIKQVPIEDALIRLAAYFYKIIQLQAISS